jgi:hypothetical protein
MALAERFREQQDLTEPAGGLVAASAALGQLVGLTHFITGPVPPGRAAWWCVHAVCAVAKEGLPVVAASELA